MREKGVQQEFKPLMEFFFNQIFADDEEEAQPQIVNENYKLACAKTLLLEAKLLIKFCTYNPSLTEELIQKVE